MIYNNKNIIRKFILNIRKNKKYNSFINKSSVKINFNIINNFNLLQYKSFFIYMSNEYEVNTSLLINLLLKNDKIVSVPYIYDEFNFLPIEINMKSIFSRNKFNINEPIFNLENIKLLKYDCVIIPCLCADIYGYRIGYGKGYYDRFLAKNMKSLKLILCPNNFLFDNIYPNNFDIKSNYIITENNIINIIK